MGWPAVFLRLGGCNLLCEGRGWRCDTIEVWRHGKSTAFDSVIPALFVKRLKQGARLIITGGEPLLQQNGVIRFIDWFRKFHEFSPVIEIETNGTIMPDHWLFRWVDFWNVSPKLSNSGTALKDRMNEAALAVFNRRAETCFKFVVNGEQDILEALLDFERLDIKKFIFMPAGSSQDELALTRTVVAEQCVALGLRYCDRLHIEIWNQKTGV